MTGTNAQDTRTLLRDVARAAELPPAFVRDVYLESANVPVATEPPEKLRAVVLTHFGGEPRAWETLLDVVANVLELDAASGQGEVLPGKAETSRRAGKGLKALVVEDDGDACMIFSVALQKAGFTSTPLTCGKEAQRVLETEIPDLVLLDLHLPDVSGVSILEYLRADERLKFVPVIVATADHNLSRSPAVTELADIVMRKPVNFVCLVDRARELGAGETP